MPNYRGNYINGMMQPPLNSEDYYDPYDPFGSKQENGDNPDDPSDDTPKPANPASPTAPPASPTRMPPETPSERIIRLRRESAERNAPPFGGAEPNASPATPTAPDPTTSTSPDTSSWDTDGYSKPGYVPESYGNAPSGWDQGKWADKNHQTPKYAVTRIIMSNGDMKDPASRNKAIADIQRAYPGTTYDGKDKVTIPGVGTIDIFQGASSGVYGPAWQPVDEGSGDGHSSSPLSQFGMPHGMPPLPQSASDQTTRSEYNSLLRKYLRRQTQGQQKGPF